MQVRREICKNVRKRKMIRCLTEYHRPCAHCFFSKMKRISLLSLLFFSILNIGHAQTNELAFQPLDQVLADTNFRFVSSDHTVDLPYCVSHKIRSKFVLGYSACRLAVEAYYFPGTSNEKALVIAGMHGSELSALDVAQIIIAQLESGTTPYYDVVVIPVLFPDNAQKAVKAHSKTNTGRYTSSQHADPNRQFPMPGLSFNEAFPFDIHGRKVEIENTYLLQLIQSYQPSRIINLHAIKDVSKAGVYADPRTDCQGIALGFKSDEALALEMAGFIRDHGGKVPGNALEEKPTGLYYKDPLPVPEGFYQPRNLNGSQLPGKRGCGASIGGWATTAVCDDIAPRNAIRLLTMEFPGYSSYQQYSGIQKESCFFQTYLYASSVTRIFLNRIEEDL